MWKEPYFIFTAFGEHKIPVAWKTFLANEEVVAQKSLYIIAQIVKKQLHLYKNVAQLKHI